MADELKNYNIPAPSKKYMTEEEVRELIAATLANWQGIASFRTLQTTILTLTDFTNSQHNHSNAAGGGQITDAALSSVVTVPKGGTGVNTLTGIAKGNGAGAFTPAVQGTDYWAPGGTDVAVADGGSGASTLTGILKGNGTSPFTAITPLAGTKIYYVADSSGGAVTRKLTFTDGVLTSET